MNDASNSVIECNLDDEALGEALDRIPASFDRFQEAHFWIHGLEQYYHLSSHFRWHLSAYLKALREFPNSCKWSYKTSQVSRLVFVTKSKIFGMIV